MQQPIISRQMLNKQALWKEASIWLAQYENPLMLQ